MAEAARNARALVTHAFHQVCIMPTQLPVTEIRVQQHAATESDVSVVSPQLPATDEAASPSAHILVLSWVALIAAVITYAWWQYLRDVMHK